jgi:hypothetical protein
LLTAPSASPASDSLQAIDDQATAAKAKAASRKTKKTA